MQEQFNRTNQTKKPLPLSSSLFDDEDGEISFRPITKGLGFSNEREEKKPSSFKVNSLNTIKREPVSKPLDMSSHPANTSLPLSTSLEASFNQPITPIKTEEVVETEANSDRLLAPAAYRVLAWSFDLVFICLGLASIFTAFNAATDFELLNLINNWKELDLAAFAIGFFVISYLSYFCLLESSIHKTFGQAMFGIHLAHKDEARELSVDQILVRSVISLFSIGLLGLPIILNFHNFLSDTSEVK